MIKNNENIRLVCAIELQLKNGLDGFGKSLLDGTLECNCFFIACGLFILT